MIKIRLSAKLGELRLTQADLSRATGIRPNTINEYYHELTDRINLEHFDLICDYLGCELTEILVYTHTVHPEMRTKTGHVKNKE